MDIFKRFLFLSFLMGILFIGADGVERFDFTEQQLVHAIEVEMPTSEVITYIPDDTVSAKEAEDIIEDASLHFIPLIFFVYETPSFMAEILETFEPQYVDILERTEDGWGRVLLDNNLGWVYLAGNRVFVPRETGMYYQINDRESVATISPQVVTILDAQGSWRLVDMWTGALWVDLAFRPPTSSLDEHLQRFGNSVAVFYMDIESGFTYMYNADRVFTSASLNKIQHALYLYVLAERGLLDLDRIHTFNPSDYREGTGRMRTRYSFGTQFTTRQLLYYSIRYSDNVAFRILVREYGLTGFLEFVREIGVDESLVRNLTGANVTARDAGLWMHAVHAYLESDGAYTELFRSDLLNTNMTLVQANYPVASKYGWAQPSFHEMAIVYADSPYILVILSNLYQGPVGGSSTFANISRRFETFHHEYFSQ
ncbi:MAG: class A beta-lactamase-related serine hydrolase [Defluviitaleaceae bacterium]|nr:class A beta-lactamase-related serine hydrolase [Defluviitaleaceae bacterium]